MSFRKLNADLFSKSRLAENKKFNFAQQHALELYNKSAICTFIPKNACSTLRYSVALSNGVISGKDGFEWVHSNNRTFNPSLKSILECDYSFVFLRCPFRRIGSFFMDKMLLKSTDALSFMSTLQSNIELEDLSFSDFVDALLKDGVVASNVHLRPQSDFLLYDEYDDYFSVEKFNKSVSCLKSKIDFHIHDARDISRHGSKGYLILKDGQYHDCKIKDLIDLKNNGLFPEYKLLFNDEVFSKIKKIYSMDINLYRSKFGIDDLLFKSDLI